MPEEKPAAERTEQPTQRKLQKAREKGQLPQSQELPAVAALLMLVVTIGLLAPTMLQWLTAQMKEGLSARTATFADTKAFMSFFNTKLANLIAFVCPVFAGLFAGAVMANIIVSGLNVSSAPISPKWNVINPVMGFKRLINTRSLVRLCLAIFKLLFITVIIFFFFQSRLDTLAALRWAWSAQIIISIAKIILALMLRICIGLLVIALADVLFQKWKYIQDLKMTKQELKEERKQTEGSPEVKSRIRKVQMQMTMRRIQQEVPKANVVLVNPTHVAVALRYDAKTMDCPVVVSKGADLIAQRIREIARAYGVPVIRRPELARTLFSTVKEGSSVPPALYMAVAEVLAMLYRMRQRKQ